MRKITYLSIVITIISILGIALPAYSKGKFAGKVLSVARTRAGREQYVKILVIDERGENKTFKLSSDTTITSEKDEPLDVSAIKRNEIVAVDYVFIYPANRAVAITLLQDEDEQQPAE